MRSNHSSKLFLRGVAKLCAFLFIFPVFVFSQSSSIVLNEINADPAPDLAGDANGDGTRDTTDDEFIELVNSDTEDIDLSGWTISDLVGQRHTFQATTILQAGQAIVVFGGGSPTGSFGGAIVQTASSGQLALNNSGDTITLKNTSEVIVIEYTYGSEAGNDQSISRYPDLTGDFTKHSEIAAAAGALFSPGTQVDGSSFGAAPPPSNSDPVLDPIGDQTVELGESLVFFVTATDMDNDSLTFFAENLPAGATFFNQQFQWMPVVSGIFQDIIFKVDDGNGGTDSESITITVTEPVYIVLNEIHADPAADLPGDANGDGTRDSTDDEFIELVNTGNSTLDLSGWTLSDAASVRHTFPQGTNLPTDRAIVIFGGGSPNGDFGGALVQTAAANLLSLNNSGDTITLKNAGGVTILEHSYGSEAGDNQSISRDPDLTGSFVKHSEISAAAGSLFSPGTKVDGSTFGAAPPPVNHNPELDPIGDQTIAKGDTLSFMVSATDADGDELNYSVENLPAGADFSAQNFFWIPAVSGTFSNIIFTVEDGKGGSDADTISILVEEPLVSGHLILNEYLLSPGTTGDANNDGSSNALQDQLLEFINRSNTSLNIAGFRIFSDGQLVHEFATGTTVPALESVVVFGGGDPSGYLGLPGYNNLVFTANTGALNLQSKVTVFNSQGWKIIDQDLVNAPGVSYSRTPEVNGNFERHNTIMHAFGSPFSPGYRVDGAAFKANDAFLDGRVNTGGSRVKINILSKNWNSADKEWQVKVSVTNRHEQEIYIPLYLRVRLQAPANSGISVGNADLSYWHNSDRDGDYFLYNRFVGADFFLTHGEESASRTVRIANPEVQPFEVVMEIFSLDRYVLAKTSGNSQNITLIGKTSIDFDASDQLLNRNSNPAEFHLFPNYPNPFKSKTTLVFSLPNAGKIQVDIFDILGRKVKRLSTNNFTAGMHKITWNGRDQNGRVAPAGVYFVHVQAGQFQATRKVILAQ